MPSERWQRLWRSLRTPLTVLAVAAMTLALAQYVSANLEALRRQTWQVDWTWIAASVLATFLFFLLSADAWCQTEALPFQKTGCLRSPPHNWLPSDIDFERITLNGA